MKKYAFLAVVPVLPAGLLFIFFSIGCTKSGSLPLTGNTADFCNIHRITFIGPSGPDTITFVYNAFGNPIRGDRAFVDDGSPRYIFRYDGQGRLQDFIGAYNNGAGEFWTRYSYSDDNRIVWDTTFTLVNQIVSWPPPENGFFLSDKKEYDQEGRITEITSYFHGTYGPVPDTSFVAGSQSYIYDARGDVVGPTYDDKINYHRTNKVWMFIDDQYSENNPFPIDAYNNYGLPTKMNFNVNQSPFPVYSPVLFMLNYANTVIDYDCELPNSKY